MKKSTKKKIVSIGITGILIGLIFFVLVPPGTSVLLSTGNPSSSSITLGNTVTFPQVNITIRGAERIPITYVNFSIYDNDTDSLVGFVVFSAQGDEQSDFPVNAFSISLNSTIQSDWYQYGYGYGYDEPSGPGFSFGYGYGYGPEILTDITISYRIVFTTQETGTFYAKLLVNSSSIDETHIFESSESSTFTVQGENVNISLVDGWNMITIPVDTNINASNLAENITGCEMISWFDGENQTYKTYIANVPLYDFALQNGYGLFAYVNQTSYVNISGGTITNVSVPLYNNSDGWNMIGWYNSTSTNASSLAENISSCNLVSYWNTTEQTFKTYITGVSGLDFAIRQSLGLFVQVNVSSTWYGQG